MRAFMADSIISERFVQQLRGLFCTSSWHAYYAVHGHDDYAADMCYAPGASRQAAALISRLVALASASCAQSKRSVNMLRHLIFCRNCDATPLIANTKYILQEWRYYHYTNIHGVYIHSTGMYDRYCNCHC